MAYFFNDIRLIWEGVKQYLVDSGVMTESAVNLWFGELKADAMEGDNVYMSTPSEFKYTIIVDKKYIEKTWSEESTFKFRRNNSKYRTHVKYWTAGPFQ